MKKLLPLLLLFPFLLSAQTHRFIYEMKYKTDPAGDSQTLTMVLDVNPDEVKFYNMKYIETDSLNKVRNTRNYSWDTEAPAIVRKRGTNRNTAYLLIDDLFKIESDDAISWKLITETIEVNGYRLQKAETTFGGRNWTAWFANKVNLQEGPYKFHGLPGMIFIISDDQGHYSFNLLKSYQLPGTYDTQAILERHAGMKPVKISLQKYKKMLLAEYNEPMRDMREHFQNNKTEDMHFYYNSIRITDLSQLKKMEDEEREYLRNNNNPIELTYVVEYPDIK
ncbi:GLPGLI family protein [Chryseobacterium salipaludis]|uniref:GLPGLI family protein n=1 Tax=Chryseobacterium TaxID=59732 RepID=UPI001FF2E5A3|nr:MULTISPECIES: GLPGLI family protein [Chryseobacterium]MCJ8498519.1 GLPGLI family protein [Chryseobacterium salipaludis]MCX3297156.1 GLPGLI family protein [Planobacterium sp. JC490]